MRRKLLFALTVSTLVAGTPVWAQSVISAHSGVIQLAEGQVELNGAAVNQKFGEFGTIKNGETLATQDGRAEVLLTPGVFLRVADHSSFRMVSNRLDDTRVEVLTGSAIVEVGELLDHNKITIVSHGANIALAKKGLYRIDAGAGGLRVYDGEASLTEGSQEALKVKKGREVQLDGKLEAKKFDTDSTDAFYRWCERRDEYVAAANISAAKTAHDSGLGYSSLGFSGGSWAFNPWFGMFTFVPFDGIYTSPFGFGYFSPLSVGYLYLPTSPYYAGGAGRLGSSFPVTRNGGGVFTPRGSIGGSATPGFSRGGMSGGGMRSAGGAIGGGGGGGMRGGSGTIGAGGGGIRGGGGRR